MYEGGAEKLPASPGYRGDPPMPLGSAFLAPLSVPLPTCCLTIRTTVSFLFLCKICRRVRMSLESATLALGPRRERHQGWCLLLDTLSQDMHVFIFIQYFQVSPPGTPCDCFPLPLHFVLAFMIYKQFTFQFCRGQPLRPPATDLLQNPGSAPPCRTRPTLIAIISSHATLPL
jgi:hypothetical protein